MTKPSWMGNDGSWRSDYENLKLSEAASCSQESYQMPKLVFTDENFAGRVYALMVEKTTVGRGDHNTLVICDDSVSKNHCEILIYGYEVIVRDLDSTNGTFIND